MCICAGSVVSKLAGCGAVGEMVSLADRLESSSGPGLPAALSRALRRVAGSARVDVVAIPRPGLCAAVALDGRSARRRHAPEQTGFDAQDAGCENAGEGVVA